MKRQTFTKEFKMEAVRLLNGNAKPAADLARELGVKRNQLYKWQEEVESFEFRDPSVDHTRDLFFGKNLNVYLGVIP